MHKLHNHPRMEKRFKVPDDHVIIDRELFDELQKMYYEGKLILSEKKTEDNDEIKDDKKEFVFGTEENRKLLQLAISMLCFKINNEIEGLDTVGNLLRANELELLDNAIASVKKGSISHADRQSTFLNGLLAQMHELYVNQKIYADEATQVLWLCDDRKEVQEFFQKHELWNKSTDVECQKDG